MKTREKIAWCMAVENTMAEIYSAYMELLPEEKEFWRKLRDEELQHLSLFDEGEMFEVFGKQAGQVALPSEEFLRKTLQHAEALKQKISRSPVTLEDALKSALMLEESVVERFMDELAAESADPLFHDLGGFLDEERTHVDRIRDMMVRKGFIKEA